MVYLTVFSLTDAPTLFTTMGIGAMICAFMCAFFLKEPKGSFAGAYEGEAAEATAPTSAY